MSVDQKTESSRTWWAYMLRCSDGSLYTGIATDVERRVSEHNAGTGAKYTRSHRPVEAIWRERCDDKSAALKREAAIKRLTRAQKLQIAARGSAVCPTCNSDADANR